MNERAMHDACARNQEPGRHGLATLPPRHAPSSAAWHRTAQWTGGPLKAPAFELPEAAPLDQAPPQKPHLIAIDLRGQTKLIMLQAVRTTLGRDEGSAIVLESPLASRQHAVLLCQDESVVLRDLGSSNGSFVNGESVQQRSLRHGDVLTLGEDCFRFLAAPLAHRAPQILDLLDSTPAELARGPESAPRWG